MGLLFTFFLCFFFEVGSAQQKREGTSDETEQKKDERGCVNILRYYSRYWIADTVGESGFRELFVQYLKVKCSVIGMQWDSLANSFGKPNREIKSDHEAIYIYKLTHFIGGENLYNSELYIRVDKNGIVRSFDKFNPS